MKNDSDKTEESQLIADDSKPVEEESYFHCLQFPKALYFIIITVLCERFTYYGLKTILILYLTQHLLMKENNAVSLYHMFVGLCYFTTIISCYISDNYLGKYKTAVLLCSVYTVGATLMSLTAIPAINISGPIISLLLISLGIGGIKVSLGALGGDQIPSSKKVLLDSFFSMFYFGIKVGAFVSTIVTPILRANVACNGTQDCYPLAFGVSAIMMGIGLSILVFGHRCYIQVPAVDSIYIKTTTCFFTALKTWYRERHLHPKKEFLEYADKHYDSAFINDLRTIMRIAVLYLPLPVYWALYQQIGSRWTLQAAQMDGEIVFNVSILPDQMSIMNVIMVIALIPVFDSVIYPFWYKITHKTRPLSRMTIGISFTCLAFFAAFGLQIAIESKQPQTLSAGASRISVVNTHPCMLRLTSAGGPVLIARGYKTSLTADIPSGSHNIQITYPKCKYFNITKVTQNVIFTANEYNFLVVNVDSSNKLSFQIFHTLQKPNRRGNPMIQLIASPALFYNYNFQFKQYKSTGTLFKVVGNQTSFLSGWQTYGNPGRFSWYFMAPVKSPDTIGNWTRVLKANGNNLQTSMMKITSSEIVMFYMTLSYPEKNVVVIPLLINNGTTISIMWQFPQYLLISIGEILVGITGLCFSYEQAPKSMKSLVNALWYLTNAFGNFIVILVAKMDLVEKQSWEYLIFAILCVIFNVVFASLAFYYRTSKREDSNKLTEVSNP